MVYLVQYIMNNF